MAGPPMTAFVLVHSPLVGPFTWSKVASCLASRGHAVATPSLAHADPPPYWQSHLSRIRNDAASLPRPVVFVGHSGAGPLLPLAAAEAGQQEGCIYVDASLPTGGRSRLETMPVAYRDALFGNARDGVVPEWGADWHEALWVRLLPDSATRGAFRSELRPAPLALYDEPVPEPDEPSANSAYLQFSAAYHVEAEEARARGWPVTRLPGEHLHMLVAPEEVAASLETLAKTLLRHA